MSVDVIYIATPWLNYLCNVVATNWSAWLYGKTRIF